MTDDDERRLLLALASCVLANLIPGGPSEKQQINVLRQMLEPFVGFMREDRLRMEREKMQ